MRRGVKVLVLCVGRPKAPLAAGIADYETRAGRYFDVEVHEVKGGRGAAQEVMRQEAEALLARLPERCRSYALSRGGERLTSAGLARELQDLSVYGPAAAAWIIGGAHGLDASVLTRVDRCIALSSFTLPHELARLVLAEQLYRAGTILRGEAYHKGAR